MNKVQVWFIVIAGLLGLGVPFLFLGLELPNAMHAAILNEAAEYVILDEEDADFWSVIPGRTGMEDIKQFYIFNCLNPIEVTTRGAKPSFKEVGPFKYRYTHNLVKRKYSDEGGVKNSKVNYVREFSHEYLGNQDDLNKEYWTANLAGLKRWESMKGKQRFQLAIEGFFELFFYARQNIVRDTVIQEVIDYFHQVDNIRALTQGLDIPDGVRRAMIYDPYYGLLQSESVYDWTMMCDVVEPYVEHEIHFFFGLDTTQFSHIKDRFCQYYNSKWFASYQKLCDKIPECSPFNVSYQQWHYAQLLKPKTYKDITHKTIYGLFEFPLYYDYFLYYLDPEYREQFGNIKWDDKAYYYLLDTRHEWPDYETDERSLLLFENMRLLFDAGMRTPKPFKNRGGSSDSHLGSRTLDLYSFELVANRTQLTKEQAFVMYCYFDYFVNNTVLMNQFGGTLERERVAHYGAMTFKDISLYFMDYLDIVIYCRSLHKRNNGRNCQNTVRIFFKMNETDLIMDQLVDALCYNEKFNTNVSTAVGWKYFVESVAFPYHSFYWDLQLYLLHSIPQFDRTIFEAMLNSINSTFANNIKDIKIKVKQHYNDHTNKKACPNTFSAYCTKKQFFINQFHDSWITKYPYPEADLPQSEYVAGWWHYIRDFVEYLYGQPGSRYGEKPLMPERPIEVPVEFSFLKKYYTNSPISKDELYKYFNNIGIYDTDVLFYIFLNIRSPSKVGKYRNFASVFFYNSTKYLIRNVEFGPMFDEQFPENIYFSYHSSFLEAEHNALDYLEGDDCTLSPCIGWNPSIWDTNEQTYEHLKLQHKVQTGAQNNNNIRKYDYYCEFPIVTYRIPTFDETGDACPYTVNSPFTEIAFVTKATDGFQFSQYPGKTFKEDAYYVLEQNTQRPLQILRETDYDYKYKDLLVNDYVLQFVSEYTCKKGVYVRNGLDMTSFMQYRSVITKPQYKGIDEPGLIFPNIEYSYPLDNEDPPYGIKKEDTYFVIEPYTGLTLKFSKKMMMSLILFYDELYEKLPDGGHGEFLPYYSLYEVGNVSDSFVQKMEDDINNSQGTRKATMISFTVLGLIFVFAGIGMIARAFFFQTVDESESSESMLAATDQPPPAQSKQGGTKDVVVVEPVQEQMLTPEPAKVADTEDLQQEEKPPEEEKQS